MAIGTSLGAYFDDEFHHQAGINTDPSQDRIDVDPEVDDQSTKPKPKLDIMKVSDTENGAPRLYVSPNKPDYDMEGWKNETGLDSLPEGQHYPDTYKLPNHITFSNESKYSSDETPGGQWKKLYEGDLPTTKGPHWEFTPSEYNLSQHGPSELQDYFNKYEKTSILNLDTAHGMAAQASEKAADALKLSRGTLPSLDSDTGIKGDVIVPASETARKLGIDTAITSEDRDTALALGPGFAGNGLIARQYMGATIHNLKPKEMGELAPDYAPSLQELKPSKTIPGPGEYPVAPHEGFNSYRDFWQNGEYGAAQSYSRLYEDRASSQQYGEFLNHVENYHAANPEVGRGPSPVQRVIRERRSITPEEMSDEEFYSHGLNQEPNSMTPEREARWLRVDRELSERDRANGSHPAYTQEPFNDVMDRLDRQDQARMDATPAGNFKDYGKVSVADRGYGSFLFKAGDSKVLPLRVSERENGKLLYVNWIGDQTYRSVNTFDKGTIKGLFKALAEKYPNAEEVAGFRVSGARAKAGSTDIARMRIPGRDKTSLPRKSIEDLSREWDDADIPGHNHPDQ